MPYILDKGGLNPMLQMVLKNVDGAIAGIVQHYKPYTLQAGRWSHSPCMGQQRSGLAQPFELWKPPGMKPGYFMLPVWAAELWSV